MLTYLNHFFCGAVIGVANVIPGVSGGTMAVVLDIYDKLINAISLKGWRRNLACVFWVDHGAGVGILAFSKLIQFLYSQYPMATNFAFLGLIVGSIPMIWKRAQKASPSGQFTLGGTAALTVCFLLMAGLALWEKLAGSQTNQAITQLNPQVFGWLFFCSIIACVGMILPGISGSFLMLVFGAYQTVISAVSSLNIAILLPVGFGCAIGLLGGAKLVGVLLKRFPQITYCGILGLVAGSLISVWPGFSFGLEGVCALAAFCVCGGAAFWFSRREKEASPASPEDSDKRGAEN